MPTSPEIEMDAEMLQFAADVRESLLQAARGEGRVHTPETIMARRVGRPLGSTKPGTKQAAKIRFDPEVLAGLRATGRGWQTCVNDTMKDWLRTHAKAA
jgi:uncharacterized protein (DUF4415 family)